MKEAPSENDEKQLLDLAQVDDINRVSILLAEDTQNVLKAYNEFFQRRPFPRKITLDDLEYLSNLTEIRSIKLENGNYAQFSLRRYAAITHNEENNGLIGKEISNKEENNMEDFLSENNIDFSAYTFPITIAWSDKEKEKIIEKYGYEMFMCVSKYGLPLKMYHEEDFNTKNNVKRK